MPRVLLSWSSGKDSAWALHLLQQTPGLEVVSLVTSFNRTGDRVAMHAVRRVLVEAQAQSVGLPLWSVELPSPGSNASCEHRMRSIWRRAVAERITHVAFGDLFLPDIRAHRERQLQETGLTPLFPLWQLPTRALALEMINAGVQAKITCVDPAMLSPSFAARDFNLEFINSLPPSVDPCGENGEFHTFVYAAPIFTQALAIKIGEIVERDHFVFADVLPANPHSPVRVAGLCHTCFHAKTVTSDRGSVFWRCMLSDQNRAFPRYPRLPVLNCPGWRAANV